MSQGAPSCISLSSDKVKACATQAWPEVQRYAQGLPKPKISALAPFFPTDACAAPINAAVSELTSYVGRKLTLVIPLFMEGETSIAGLAIDMDHFYQVSGKCDVEVSQAAKLVALIVDIE
ncbi:hypothetical protein PCH_Pc17g01220 [Penicillium rubens Wisconsin 54-1255]|uniref:Uncharacterized protein n=1 Tax=Penicillium rubens (strain ATCC 28089 / DSM 1075 / NRRL 1951 / Wisconsin 54-1255) TaxID=500485 RepID=B6HB40_PENRW|nr:hypothetical protein PCH_Pc17g01220 [Penicillium rubens Wisconsin 54-1255]